VLYAGKRLALGWRGHQGSCQSFQASRGGQWGEIEVGETRGGGHLLSERGVCTGGPQMCGSIVFTSFSKGCDPENGDLLMWGGNEMTE
jgi:hypothetical protein